MDDRERLEQQVAEAVLSFHKTQLGVTCELITVDLHADHVVATLSGATCPAEQAASRDKSSRGRIEELHDEVFNAAKPGLESTIGEILGREVRRSRLDVDPQTGDAVVLFTLQAEGPARPGER